MKKLQIILLTVMACGMMACSSLSKTTASTASTGSTSAVASQAVTAASNVASKIDNLLDLYDQYIGKYIDAYKALRNGDPLTKISAATQAAQLLQDANGVGSQLESLKSSMSSDQVSRWTSLAQQLAQAVSDTKAEMSK